MEINLDWEGSEIIGEDRSNVVMEQLVLTAGIRLTVTLVFPNYHEQIVLREPASIVHDISIRMLPG